jgi:hypothetical protein
MAPGYMGWAVFALVIGLVIFGLPALLLARKARDEEQAGEMQHAIGHSYRARTVAVVTVIVMALIWIVALNEA